MPGEDPAAPEAGGRGGSTGLDQEAGSAARSAGERDVVAAVFRPADDRLANAIDLLESLGAIPIPDPMLEISPTGRRPRSDADFAVLTSKTGVEIAAGERGDAGKRTGGSGERWDPDGATVCAIGSSTADALRAAGYEVDLVPEEFSSSGLVDALQDRVDGTRVEVARSDHGSQVLPDGLEEAGAYVHETVLYELTRPRDAGESAELAAGGHLDAALFTSSLTVAHFLDAAEARGCRADAVARLNEAVVGVIGDPTRETAAAAGIEVDVVPETASFEALATEVVERAAPGYHE
jgi:uroporphyrinogen-III synthase